MPSNAVALQGGLNLSESPLDVFPGCIKDSTNFFESAEGGFERIGGYERFDGRRSPSSESYYVATFAGWSNRSAELAVGDDVTVGPLSFHVLDTEHDADADEMRAVVCAIDGEIPEDLADTPIAWEGTELVSMSPRDLDDDEDLLFLEAAWTHAREQIGELPGTERPAGVLQVADLVVAFRNDGTTPRHFYQSDDGWVEGRFGRVVEITGYTADAIYPGETIDGGKFKVLAVCDWYDADDVPVVTKAWLVVAPLTAADEPATGANTASGGASFTIASVIQPVEAWGSYIEFIACNFLAHPEAENAWFADGKNMALCYSPEHKAVLPVCSNFNKLEDVAVTVSEHAEKLKVAMSTGTFLSSEPGKPFNFGGQYGAAAVGFGDYISAFAAVDSEHLAVFSKSSAKRLVGADKSTWSFVNVATSVGALPRSVQKLDDVFSFSARGAASLVRTDTTGGYYGGIVSLHIQELIDSMRAGFVCSTTLTGKEQVRWYFDDGTFLMMSRLPGDEGGTRYSFARGDYPDKPVRAVSTAVWSDGTERTFFTSDDGYVYEAEVGSNFDGGEIYSFCELHANNLRTPGRNKSFKRVFFEARSRNYVALTMSYTVNYGTRTFDARDIELFGGRSAYDAALYDQAVYDSESYTRAKATLKGKGFAISFTVAHSGKFALPFKITGYTLDYELLGKAIN